MKNKNGPFHSDLSALTADDFNFKFRIKLSEYLNIKMLSDIAFQKSVLMQTQVTMAQERQLNSYAAQPHISEIVRSIRENK